MSDAATLTSPAPRPPVRRSGRSARRRTPGDRLRDALMALGECRGQILTHEEKPWASITFAGTRHRLAILFAGEEAVEAGEIFVAELPEHEFAIPGQLVADATVSGTQHRLLPAPRLVVECDLLLLEES